MFARKVLALVCLSTVLTFGLAGVAEATCTGYCPPPTIATSTTVANPGQSVVIFGNGWCAGSTVTISFDAGPSITAAVRKNGTFSRPYKTSMSTSLGNHTFTVTGLPADCGSSTSASATVLFIDYADNSQSAAAFTGRPSSPDGGQLFPAAHLIEWWQVALVALAAIAFAMRTLRRRLRIRRVILYGHPWRERR